MLIYEKIEFKLDLLYKFYDAFNYGTASEIYVNDAVEKSCLSINSNLFVVFIFGGLQQNARE